MPTTTNMEGLSLAMQKNSLKNGDHNADEQPSINGASDDSPRSAVLQVERNDYAEVAPSNRKRAQSMEGFDDCCTDIVDYIVRCTHKIWDERDIGLIYTHYTHNCILYGTMGTITIVKLLYGTPFSDCYRFPNVVAWPLRFSGAAVTRKASILRILSLETGDTHNMGTLAPPPVGPSHLAPSPTA